MARRNPNDPPKEHRWRPGQSGNPKGGNAHDPRLKMLKKLTKEELIEVGNLVVKGSVSELKEMAKNPNASVIQTMVASVAVKVITKGDMHSLDILLNRLIGKVKEEIEHTGLAQPQVIITLPDNGRDKEPKQNEP